jgi:hypothetical protein
MHIQYLIDWDDQKKERRKESRGHGESGRRGKRKKCGKEGEKYNLKILGLVT